MINFKDFTIRIGAKDEEGGHLVKVSSPAGEANGRFTNPISRDELSNKLIINRLAVRSSEDTKVAEGLRDIGPVTQVDDLREMGSSLFQSLFKDEIMAAYSKCKGLLELAPDEGLRIRIRPDRDMDEYAEIMNLPWEFLWDEGSREFIDQKEWIVVVRYPEAPTSISSLTKTAPPLKVLAVASEPKDCPPLRLGKEMLSLMNTFKEENIPVEVKFVDPPTLGKVSEEARQWNPHVFHFMGHGGFDPDTGKSVLIFETKDEMGHRVSGEILKAALAESIKLVFLNACETARIGESNPFAAISTELALAGKPAILAMQFPISDAAAIKFSKTFYTMLSEGYPIDRSLSDARKTLLFEPSTQNEFGTPVLFMRSPDGVLFKFGQQSEEEGQ